MGTGEFNAGVTPRWTCIPYGGLSKYLQSLQQKAEISAALMSHLARVQTLPR